MPTGSVVDAGDGHHRIVLDATPRMNRHISRPPLERGHATAERSSPACGVASCFWIPRDRRPRAAAVGLAIATSRRTGAPRRSRESRALHDPSCPMTRKSPTSTWRRWRLRRMVRRWRSPRLRREGATVRQLTFPSGVTKPLDGTDDARSPFFSPDGRWIGFFARGKLKKVTVSGASFQRATIAQRR